MLIEQAKLHKELFLPAYKLFCQHRQRIWQKKTFENAYTADESLVAIGEQDKPLHGYLLARCNLDEIDIDDIAVHPQVRNQGIASRLIDALIKQSLLLQNEQAIKRILLEVDVNNTAAIRLYQKHQFRQIGIRKNYYQLANGHLSDAMVLSLDKCVF